jgi:hypothetical protein
MALEKSDIYSFIWASCDELQEGVDSSQYKDYLLLMLSNRYVSDNQADYDGFETPIINLKGASSLDSVALAGGSDIEDKINGYSSRRRGIPTSLECSTSSTNTPMAACSPTSPATALRGAHQQSRRPNLRACQGTATCAKPSSKLASWTTWSPSERGCVTSPN